MNEQPVQQGPTTDGPYCGVCTYPLAGLTDSSKCPECGGALVEVLRWPAMPMMGRRWRTEAEVFGMPVVHVALGPRPDEKIGRARGFIAIGDEAMGVVAVGGLARGVIAVGGFAAGGFTFGGFSLAALVAGGGMSGGLGFAWGGLAIGGIANAGVAIGGVASGGVAIGYLSRGGVAIGPNAWGPRTTAANVPEAWRVVEPFFGAPGGGIGSDKSVLIAGGSFVVTLVIAALVTVIALSKKR
ncbi:MAG: hypothetical protein AAF235_02065 [Planctomycetota bacterium]